MNQGEVYEIAQLHIKPESRESFEEVVPKALAVLRSVPGCKGAKVLLGVEEPDEPCFVVQWDSVDAHESFREAPIFAEYRATIADTFAAPPSYRHFVVGPE
ncbi:MAG: putative quinol monooxygenase [Solirubrobacterales bacterium]